MPSKLAALHSESRVRARVPDGPRDWFRIGDVRMEVVGEQPADPTETTTRSTADVYIYEAIGGWWGMTADDFVRDVAGLDVDHLDVHLNSPGGDAYEGIAMANVLRQHRATVTIWIDGLAASAASVVAMAGDEIVMGLGSNLMIHDASSYGYGDAADLRKAAEMLDSLSDSVAGTYAARAGGTAAEWRAVMVEEAWYTGEEAVAAGLADRVATDADNGRASGEQVVPGSTSAGSLWDWWDTASSADRHASTLRALYAHAGRADAPAPPMPGHARNQPPAATASGSNTHERSQPVAFSDEQLTTMRQQLGLAEDADEATIVDALSEALTERAETPDNATTNLPQGTVAVDESTLAQLKADAAAGREARQKQLADERSSTVEAAVRDGRIPRARADHWKSALAADPEGAAQHLKNLAPGLIPVDERGHDQAGAAETAQNGVVSLDAVRSDPTYKNWSL